MGDVGTSRNPVNLVLYEEIDKRHKGSEEGPAKDLPVVDGLGVVWAKGETSDGPWQGGNKIRNHEDVVPVVVVGRGNIGPSSTGEGPKDTHSKDELGKGRVWSCGQEVPQGNKKETRTYKESCSELAAVLLC